MHEEVTKFMSDTEAPSCKGFERIDGNIGVSAGPDKNTIGLAKRHEYNFKSQMSGDFKDMDIARSFNAGNKALGKNCY